LILVQKFRKRTSFLEYMVHVLTKSVLESSSQNEDILGWYDETQTFLSKRNELMLGPWRMIIKKQDGLVQIQGSNENKYAAAITEFSPERLKKKKIQQQMSLPATIPDKKQKTKQMFTKKMLRSKPSKYHFLIPTGTTEQKRVELEQKQKPVCLYLDPVLIFRHTIKVCIK
ncbi:unnamed protein product, partial [Didymodactylos carnosus]